MPTVTVIQPTITEEKAAKIHCAAYCRVSSDSEDQLNSFMAQTRYYSRIFENSQTEELIDIYADEGVVLSISLDTFYSNKNYATRKI